MKELLQANVGEAVHVANLDGSGVAVARFDKCQPPEKANMNSSGLGAGGGEGAGPTVGVWLRGALVGPAPNRITARERKAALIPDLMLGATDVKGIGRGPVDSNGRPPEWASSRLVKDLTPIFLGSHMSSDELWERVAVVTRALLGVPEPGDAAVLLSANHRPLREWANANLSSATGFTP